MKFSFPICLFSLLLYYTPSYCQLDSTCFPATNEYVKYIDSMYTYYRGEKSKFVKDSFSRNISEGPITTIRSGTSGDTTDVIGGFSLYSFTGRWPASVYYINKNDNLLSYLVRKYYFKSNQLLYAYMELQHRDHAGVNILYKIEEYFDQGKVVSRTIINNGLREQDSFRVDISMQREAESELEELLRKCRR